MRPVSYTHLDVYKRQEQPPVSLFSIHVARGADGRYRVIDLPPYTP